jgi:hypothetical protein
VTVATAALSFYVLHAASLALFAAAAYGLGRRIAGPLSFRSPWEEGAFGVALGLGGLTTLFFAAGLFHAFRRGVVFAILFVALAVGLAPLTDAARRLRALWARSFRPQRVFAALGLAILSLWLCAEALYPPGGFDALMYHLPAARAFASTHGLGAMPQLRYPVFPQLNEILWGAALLVHGDVLAQLLTSLFHLTVLAGLVALGLRLAGPVAAALSAGFWLAAPIVYHLGRSAFVEPAVAAFATLSFLALAGWKESRQPRWLVISGALAGFAAATKYTGLVFAAVFAAASIVEADRGARAKSFARFSAAAALAALPWYGRTALLAGNPVWPFLGEVFGFSFWTPRDVASAVWSLRHEGWPNARLWRLPWDLVSRQPSGAARLFPLVFALLPLGALLALRRGPAIRRWAVILATAYFLFWFSTTRQIRFLVPVMPIVCFLSAYGVAELAKGLVTRVIERRALAVGLAAFGLLAGPQLLRAAFRMHSNGLPPASAALREEYLQAHFATYPFYQRLNAEHGGRYVAYAFRDEEMKYYCRGLQWGDWFGKGRYADVDLRSGEGLLGSLRALGAGFLLVDARDASVPLPDDAVFREHFRPIFERSGVRGFQVK